MSGTALVARMAAGCLVLERETPPLPTASLIRDEPGYLPFTLVWRMGFEVSVIRWRTESFGRLGSMWLAPTFTIPGAYGRMVCMGLVLGRNGGIVDVVPVARRARR